MYTEGADMSVAARGAFMMVLWRSLRFNAALALTYFSIVLLAVAALLMRG